MYIPQRDSTPTHYKTADTDIQHCIQYITNIPHSVLTGDVNAHSTLLHSYTDDQRTTNSRWHQQLGPHTTKHKPTNQISPRCRGQLNTHYHQTTYP